MSELPEGFIPHDGGPCPVDGGHPTVMFRDGRTHRFRLIRASEPYWSHIGDPDDIIAYRPEEPQP